MSRLVYSLLFETEREPGAEIVEFYSTLTNPGIRISDSRIAVLGQRRLQGRPVL